MACQWFDTIRCVDELECRPYQTLVLKKVTLSYQLGVALCNGKKKTLHFYLSSEWL